MYESEANHQIERSDSIPADIQLQFKEARDRIQARTVLPWSEHCTECAWPTCYSSCDLYTPRSDGRCQRFVEGMVRVECPAALNGYVLKINFKRWAKLWAPASIRLYSAQEALSLEARDYRIGTTLYHLPIPKKIKTAIRIKRYGMKKRSVGGMGNANDLPTSFLFECYNPGQTSVGLSLTLRPVTDAVKIHFQQLFVLEPGFHRLRVPVSKITRILDLNQPFSIEIVPNEIEEHTTLYFGVMEFVRETAEAASSAAKVKCVVWDLDNTLWDGILVEDGHEGLNLKPSVAEVIRALDERGILNSIASKNDPGEAMRALRAFGIEEYFLSPQISWRPKSEAISEIARQLNIGKESLLFIDDSPFELDQVTAMHPEVRTLPAADYRKIPEMEACQVPVSAETRERRKMYQLEAARQDTAEGFGSDYIAFLRHCQIRLQLRPLTEETLERVHELTQRTNQMNFSGMRYDRGVLRRIAGDPFLQSYVMSCDDRFGSYGTVGFGIVDTRVPRLTDLMFSCRVQSKRVEHAFLAHILRKHIGETDRDFFANYRKTERNAPSGQVFADMGMEELEVSEGVTSLVFRRNYEVPDDKVIEIDDLVVATGTR